MGGSNQAGTGLKLACEIAGDRVLAGRVSDGGNAVECASYDLRSGIVVPDLTEPNIRDRTTVFQTVRDALDNVAGRSREVIAVLREAGHSREI